jgi:hypothetical protein
MPPVKGLLRLAVMVAFALVPMAALASSGSSQVWATNCNKEQYKPQEIIVACGDAGTYVNRLKWSSWTTTKASGKGEYTYNTCKPMCDDGNLKSFAVDATLTDAKSCKNEPHKAFTKLELTFTQGRPTYVKKSTYSLTLGCPF